MAGWGDELDAYADLLNLDEKEYRRLGAPARRNPKLKETARRLLRLRLLRERIDPDDPPAFPMPRDLPRGDLGQFFALFGKQRRQEFGVTLSGSEGHVGVFGSTGTGKSTLILNQIIIPAIRAGLAVWIFDCEDEYRTLLRVFDSRTLLAFDAQRLPLNPFQAHKDPVRWAGEIGDVFRQTQFCRDGSVNLLTQILMAEYLRRGVFEGSEDYPSIADVFKGVIGKRYDKESRTRRYTETLENRLVTLMQQLNPGIATVKSVSFPELLSKSVLFRLHGVSGTTRDFFVTLLLKLFMVYRTGVVFDRPKNVLILEEVHNYIG